MKTIGVSPKLVAAVVAAVVSYLLGQEVLELPAWAVLALNVVSVAGATFAANPGVVEPDADPDANGAVTVA